MSSNPHISKTRSMYLCCVSSLDISKTESNGHQQKCSRQPPRPPIPCICISLSVSPSLCVCLRLSVPQCHSAALCVSRRLSRVLCTSLSVTGTPALNVARAGKQSTSAKVPKATPASADPNETGRCVTGQQIGLILFTCKTYTTNSDNRW